MDGDSNFLGKYQLVAGQFVRFVFVGLSGVAINFTVLNVLSDFFGITKGEGIILISAVAFFTALVNSYFWNNVWTFKDKTTDHGRKFTTFLVVSIIGAVINSAVVYLITTYIPVMGNLSDKVWLNLANLIAVCLAGIWNFSGYKFLVFKK